MRARRRRRRHRIRSIVLSFVDVHQRRIVAIYDVLLTAHCIVCVCFFLAILVVDLWEIHRAIKMMRECAT